MKNPWQIKSSNIHYDNPWITVTEHQVINPSGESGIYGVVGFKKVAVAIIPLDEDNFTWIVGQYRFPTKSYEWEIAEGGCDEGENIVETAHRELMEEVGVKAQTMIPFLEMQLSNSVTNETSISFIARDLTILASNAPESSEDLKVRKIHFSELVAMVMNGEIKDALTIASVLKLHAILNKEKI